MKTTSKISLATFIFLSNLFSTSIAGYADGPCSGSIDNTDVANDLIDQAVIVTGDYTITNVKTGASLIYMHDSQPNFLLTTDSLNDVLDSLDGASGTTASNVIHFTDNNDKYSSVRLAEEESLKCMSAQWNFDTFCDGYGVAYTCSIGPGGVTGTLETTKQRWLMIPCDDPNDDGDNVKSNIAVSCPKNSDWVQAHIPGDKTGFLDRHPGCKDLLDSSSKMRKVRRFDHPIRRDDDYSGTYCIVAVDHIEDMHTRALSGTQVKAFADAEASLMVPYDNTDPNQVWTISKVSS